MAIFSLSIIHLSIFACLACRLPVSEETLTAFTVPSPTPTNPYTYHWQAGLYVRPVRLPPLERGGGDSLWVERRGRKFRLGFSFQKKSFNLKIFDSIDYLAEGGGGCLLSKYILYNLDGRHRLNCPAKSRIQTAKHLSCLDLERGFTSSRSQLGKLLPL